MASTGRDEVRCPAPERLCWRKRLPVTSRLGTQLYMPGQCTSYGKLLAGAFTLSPLCVRDKISTLSRYRASSDLSCTYTAYQIKKEPAVCTYCCTTHLSARRAVSERAGPGWIAIHSAFFHSHVMIRTLCVLLAYPTRPSSHLFLRLRIRSTFGPLAAWCPTLGTV